MSGPAIGPPITGKCAPVLDGVVQRLCEHVTDGLLSVGAQLCVLHQDDVLADVAVGTDGLGRPLTQETLLAIYCTGKPLTAIAVAQLVDEGLVDYETTLGEILNPRLAERLESVTLRSLLTHTAGVHHLTVKKALLAGPQRRQRMTTRVGPVPRWRQEVDAAYSEHGAWELLGQVLESVTGSRASHHIAARVISPLGLADELFVTMTDEQYEKHLQRLGVNVYMHHDEHIPLLYERTRAFCTEQQLGYGARGSALSLARFYQHLLHVHLGKAKRPLVSPRILRHATAPHRPRTHDRVLGRPCTFGLGFMVELRDHRFGGHLSPSSFGHSGNAGVSCAFADPGNELVVALIYNGYIDAGTSIIGRRHVVCDAIYTALGLRDESAAASAGL